MGVHTPDWPIDVGRPCYAQSVRPGTTKWLHIWIRWRYVRWWPYRGSSPKLCTPGSLPSSIHGSNGENVDSVRNKVCDDYLCLWSAGVEVAIHRLKPCHKCCLRTIVVHLNTWGEQNWSFGVYSSEVCALVAVIGWV